MVPLATLILGYRIARSLRDQLHRTKCVATGPVSNMRRSNLGPGSRFYWVVVALLIVFGAITGFSIGLPFLLLGVTLAVLEPARGSPAVFWPTVSGVLALVAAYVLVSPLSCTRIESASTDPESVRSPSSTTCSSLLGIDYSGTGNYNPSLMPALLAALAAGFATAGLVALIVRRPRTN